MNASKRIIAFIKAIEEFREVIYVLEEKQVIKAFMTIGKCRDIGQTFSHESRGFYVDPFMIRGGIGSKLLNYCEQRALELGFKNLVLWALGDNLR